MRRKGCLACLIIASPTVAGLWVTTTRLPTSSHWGAVGFLTLGKFVIGEGSDPLRLTFAGISIFGIIGLKLSA